MKKLLLIIDPQIDFITGTLPVPGAVDAMDSLAEYIRRNNSDYDRVIVTADRHPMRHCSFKAEGGKWPAHCVADMRCRCRYIPAWFYSYLKGCRYGNKPTVDRFIEALHLNE